MEELLFASTGELDPNVENAMGLRFVNTIREDLDARIAEDRRFVHMVA